MCIDESFGLKTAFQVVPEGRYKVNDYHGAGSASAAFGLAESAGRRAGASSFSYQEHCAFSRLQCLELE